MRPSPVLAMLTAVLLAVPAACRATPPEHLLPDSPAARARIAWWRDAKFGLFMHWGVYSILGRGEWVQWNEQIPVEEYAKLAGQFHPDHFDPNAWAAAAKSAGMRYTVLTSRHHDGFALFDDPGSDFTAMKSAAHHDFVADYVTAVRRAGLKVGLYYSPLDWRYPGFFFPDVYRSSAEQMRDQYHRQLGELASNYGPLDILWFDGGGVDWLGFNGVRFRGKWGARPVGQHYTGTFSWQDKEAVDDLRRRQPNVILNDRTDADADFHSREGDAALGDFDSSHPWELCTTLAGAWGYRPGAAVKPLDDCIRLLVGAVGRDGNLLLNVGPRPDGRIEADQLARLHQIGDWLARYGPSIYATRGGPYLPGPFGVSTYRDHTVYLHLLRPPAGPLSLPPLPIKVVDATCLTGGTATVAQTDASLTVTLAGNAPAVDTIVAINLASSAADVKPIATVIAATAPAGQR
jgi:alpha-L-fucosidase